jgi:hypothetical protein
MIHIEYIIIYEGIVAVSKLYGFQYHIIFMFIIFVAIIYSIPLNLQQNAKVCCIFIVFIEYNNVL